MSRDRPDAQAIGGPAAAAQDRGLELLVIQPTPFSNLDCDYCYLPDRQSRKTISPEVLGRVYDRVLASRHVRGAFSVVWHAGEPLVLPVSFYEEAFDLLSRANRQNLPVRHCFQTNATLIDRGWCELIERHDVRIGVSLDGPRFLHDAHRKTRGGQGTYDRVMRGLRCLQEHGTPFYVISVVTRDTLDHADDLFRFYRDHGISRVGFNIEEVEGVNRSSTLAIEGIEDRFRRFLRRFYRLIEESPFPIEIREIDGLKRFISSHDGFLDRNQENTPLRILSVDCDGNFSTFSPELLGMKDADGGDFLLGNLCHDDLDEVARSEKFRRLASEVAAGVAACRSTCDYFGVCGGGSPSNKYFENGSFETTETLHCRLTKQVMTEVTLDHLETSLAGKRPTVAATH